MEFFLSPAFMQCLVTSLCPLTLLMLSDNHPYFGLSGASCWSALESIHGLGSNMVWVLCGCTQPVVQRSSSVYHVPGRRWSARGPFPAHGNSAPLGPFFKHCPHSEKDAQGSIGKHWKFYRSERIRAAIYVLYPFSTNSFIFSSLFILKQIHTRQ